MKKNKILTAFTLIELMVIIVIIWILIVGWSQINLNTITDKNKIEIFTNSIISQFETIRNDTLLWKWVDSNVWVPDAWKITFDTSWTGTIKPSYLSGSWINYPSKNIIPDDFYSISDINCLDISKNFVSSGSITEVHIQWNNFTLSGDCTSAEKILEFTTNFRNESKVVQINTLNWLIEVQ